MVCPGKGEVGIPKKFDFIKHMPVAILTSITVPQGAKVVSAAILEKGEDLIMSDGVVYHLGQYPVVICINFLHHVRDPRTVLDSGFHAVNSRFQVLDSRLLISGTWIQDCNRWWVSRLLELYSGFQSPKSRFHKQKNPVFWILQLNLSWHGLWIP